MTYELINSASGDWYILRENGVVICEDDRITFDMLSRLIEHVNGGTLVRREVSDEAMEEGDY